MEGLFVIPKRRWAGELTVDAQSLAKPQGVQEVSVHARDPVICAKAHAL